MRYHVISDSKNPLLTISSIGYAASPAVTRFGPSRRNHYIIHYCLSGKGYFNGNLVSAGQGFLIEPDMEELYFPDASDPWEFLWILSSDRRMGEFFPAFAADPKTHIFRGPDPSLLRGTANWVMAHSNTAADSILLLETFLRLFRQQKAVQGDGLSGRRLYLDAAINYLDANMHCPVSVQELTSFLGISQPYLYSIFQETFHLSPKQYILQTKLNHAKKLLSKTNYSIAQVAAAVGFDDPLGFSKFFSARVGTSPTAYREQNAYVEDGHT